MVKQELVSVLVDQFIGLDGEEWRKCPYLSPALEISSKGRIRKYVTPRAVTLVKTNGKDDEGRTYFYYEGSLYMLDEVVADTYLPSKDIDHPVIQHTNGIMDDNRVENLKWAAEFSPIDQHDGSKNDDVSTIIEDGEEWRNVSFLSSDIQVSDQGRARKRTKSGKYKEILPKEYNGYMYFNVDNKSILVHRAIADAFIPNPNNLRSVKHRDENTRNNKVENLYRVHNAIDLGYAIDSKYRIFCIQWGTIYESLLDASLATGVPEMIIKESIKQKKLMCGLQFIRIARKGRPISKNKSEYIDPKVLMDIASNATSVAQYIDEVHKLQEN